MTSKFHIPTLIQKALQDALIHSNGNMVETAKLTGLSRATCYRLLKKHKINLDGLRLNAGPKLGRHN